MRHTHRSLVWALTLSVGTIVMLPSAYSAPTAPMQATVAAVPMQEAGPQVHVQTPTIDWGADNGSAVPYQWSTQVDNPNGRAVIVKVKLDFIDGSGSLIHQDELSGEVAPGSSVILRSNGTIGSGTIVHVAEARGVPTAWWSDEPYKFRTVAAFVDGLQRLEVFFVLEDWQGRPMVSAGTVDLYIVERERLHAGFAGGGMRRSLSTLYARRFEVSVGDFAKRRIGFISTDYSPPALTLGPIHYSIFDREPHGDEGLVRVVFRTASGVEIVGEDRVYF